MAEPKSTISCVSNVYVRAMMFEKAGDVNKGHCHVFDHQTLLATGALKAVVDGKESTFKAPQIIFIRAGLEHEFTALEDNTVAYCIHALRDGERVEDIIDPAGVPQGIFTDGEASQKLFDVAKPLIQLNDDGSPKVS